ncbi:A/G-specific adenine glycosylase [Polymorphobacter sp. PAMC 29334]|uniref:A/G-specific adenine glycosylase n=1 Tax=Polymorphobacter sp. PAMC 29334 TaxID=2862331 RepID=UPI001C67519F|nr:A/G-specific adenine glycosylase [Polymorphobacter sp. PAMC 29334]QYE34452.1 A/G-specific adenine glycosylase [Polymorphobacter sp. PAMC 29334]
MPVDEDCATPVSAKLLAWYDANARALPWRSPPGTPPPTPYRVWLSEIMLQQTTTAAVAPYYAKFLAVWPSVAALAAADDADVMREWAGLGYYARARNLLACARAVVARGGWPDDEAGLRALPGVGGYTAAAIAAIAFDQRAVVVDGNVERVVSRLFAVAAPLLKAKRELYALADRLTPETRAGDHAQAMMDLGATICTPRAPACGRCPLSEGCVAFAEGEPTRFPIKPPKVAKPVRYGIAYWIEHDGAVLLERRPGSGLLGGMLGLPTGEWSECPPKIPCHPRESGDPMSRPLVTLGPRFRGDDTNEAVDETVIGKSVIGVVRHVFTHFELRLTVVVTYPSTRPDTNGIWHPVATIAAAGLPTLFARCAEAVLRARADAVQSPSLALETTA